MPASMDPLVLAADFPAASAEDWRALVAGVLRKSGLAEGADPIEALTSTTYDGIDILPLYTSASTEPGWPGRPPYVRGATADGATMTGWDVRAQHRDPDPSRSRAAARNDLETGATSLWLMLGDAGLALPDLPAVLAD